MSQELETAIEAAHAAGAIIKQNYDKPTNVQEKPHNQIVTETDLAADQAIKTIIKAKFPQHSIFSEESGLLDNQSDYVWIIDPLDGTTNFVHHLGIFGVSIALVYKNQRQLGVVYNPLTQELFSATIDEGSKLNNGPIKTSSCLSASAAVISLGRPSRAKEREHAAAKLKTLANTTRSQRLLGSTALQLCYVACGRLDAHIDIGTNFYDGAAGALIAEQAGAIVTNFNEQPWQPPINGRDDLIASAPAIYQDLVKIL